ncbi:DUF3601 domain-containing protein [Roseimicrobium sp. ORNL1]|uniref:DUF3601 domain-containing protein n=1 Tax=Roseimicrobium sp. ORNL1 TaxID=2711231 RepID=UPI0013E1B6C2|nr:DUF3601 domain-containing protein [Roseimicrobium sp. ORNL1]QIF02280.1 DUF3601 domain-containing protein [Roseimicrobium sp. ORNL1]
MASSSPAFTASDLVPGKTYRVVKEFLDYDGLLHSPGETWTFVAKNFLPYDDGLTIYTEHHGRNGIFRLQWRPEAQASIIDFFSEFVVEV